MALQFQLTNQLTKANVLGMLREAVSQGKNNKHYGQAKSILAAYEALELITNALIARQKEQVRELVDQLQNIRGVAPTIILRLIVDQNALTVLIDELQLEIDQELERLNIEMLQERRKQLFDALMLLQGWQRELGFREARRAQKLEAQAMCSQSFQENSEEIEMELGVVAQP